MIWTTTSTSSKRQPGRGVARLTAMLALVLLPAGGCRPAGGGGAVSIPDFSLKTLGGELRTLADYKAPVTLINFFFPT